MSRAYKYTGMLVLLLALLLPACNLNEATTTPENVYTQAAQTAEVAQALTAMSVSPTPSITPTLEESLTIEPTNTLLITLTDTPGGPTNTPANTNTPRPAESTACDNALFVEDINYPDYSEIAPGASFVKTWRFKNLGPCTWTEDYRIVFSYVSDTGKDGIFDPPPPAHFPDSTAPGEFLDVSIGLEAPTDADGYIVVFRLQNDKGFFFGPEFWVIFVVK